MKIRFKYNKNVILMFGAAGHVIFFPYVLFKHSKEGTSDKLFRHELQHVYQILENGYFTFFAKYIWYSLRYGYKKNPFEMEARFHAHDKLTEAERFLRNQ